MNEQELSPETQAQMDHMDGKHVVVEYVDGNGKGTRFLLESLDAESDAVALWQDLAYDSSLAEIRMRWDPKLADELRKHFATPTAEATPAAPGERER